MAAAARRKCIPPDDPGGPQPAHVAPVQANRQLPFDLVPQLARLAHIGTTRSVYARTDRRTLRDIYDTFTRSPRQAIRDLEEQERREGRSNRERV